MVCPILDHLRGPLSPVERPPARAGTRPNGPPGRDRGPAGLLLRWGPRRPGPRNPLRATRGLAWTRPRSPCRGWVLSPRPVVYLVRPCTLPPRPVTNPSPSRRNRVHLPYSSRSSLEIVLLAPSPAAGPLRRAPDPPRVPPPGQKSTRSCHPWPGSLLVSFTTVSSPTRPAGITFDASG